MKKYLYYFLLVILGLLLSFLAHAGLEILALKMITSDLSKFGESYIWQNWELIHRIASIILTILGISIALVLAPRFWQILYVEKRYGKPWL